jgi:hypothetical protein
MMHEYDIPSRKLVESESKLKMRISRPPAGEKRKTLSHQQPQ